MSWWETQARVAYETCRGAIGDPPDQGTADAVIDVVDLGSGLLGWGDQSVRAATDTVKSAQLVVVASPAFQATYTGLPNCSSSSSAPENCAAPLPFRSCAAPRHPLAPELLRKPVLVEIGCTCPAPGLYLLDSAYEDGQELRAWLESAGEFAGGPPR